MGQAAAVLAKLRLATGGFVSDGSSVEFDGRGWWAGDGDSGGAGVSRLAWGVLPPAAVAARFGIIKRDGASVATGAGKGKAQRAMGKGQDQAAAAVAKLQAWVDGSLVARAAILVGIEADNALGVALLKLSQRQALRAAVYLEYGNGRRGFKSRQVFHGRGQRPSDTSIDEAAAVATAAAWSAWCEYSALCGDELTAAARRHLAGYAWRAAFASLNREAAAGSGATVGRHAGQQAAGVPVAESAGTLAVERESLQRWAELSGVLPDTAQAIARRAVASFVWRSLVLSKGRGAGAAAARTASIQRARLLIRLVHGQDLATAARLAGYASGASALETLHKSKSIHTLKAAAGVEWRKLPGLARLVKLCRKAGLAAGRAVKLQRLAGSPVMANTPSARLWLAAVEQRAGAIVLSQSAKRALASAREAVAHNFDLALPGWRRGWNGRNGEASASVVAN